jgi:hypothetical protein
MPQFSWLTQTAAIAQLQARLSSTSFWTSAECWLYLTEALRHWSALTECWPSDFPFSQANGAWINTGTVTGSPRLRSVTDSNLYTSMQYMLLENPVGGAAWTGTPQFSLSDLQTGLQDRAQEVIQSAACNFGLVTPSAAPNTRRMVLPDTVLQPRRVRFMAVSVNTTGTASIGSYNLSVAASAGVAVGQIVAGTGISPGTFVAALVGANVTLSQPTTAALSGTAVQFFQPQTLTREDSQSFQYFEPDYLQETGVPLSWSMVSEPPLAIDLDIATNAPGQCEVLALVAAPVFAPPAASLLGVPDDWSWLPMYGALADVLSREPEATDRARAKYCIDRYTAGLDMIRNGNWLLKATVNGEVADTPSLQEVDDYDPEWQCTGGGLPTVVQAGIDFMAPYPGYGQSVTATLVGNAPLLDPAGKYVQVARDDWPSILGYAAHVAAFKQGGAEFAATMPLLMDFYRAAAAFTKKLLTYGPYADILRGQGEREETEVVR